MGEIATLNVNFSSIQTLAEKEKKKKDALHHSTFSDTSKAHQSTVVIEHINRGNNIPT